MSATGRYPISPLFGEIAMNLGLAEPAQVMDALCLQSEQESLGLRPQPIGRILVDRGALTEDDVVEILQEVERQTRILEIPGFQPLEFVSADDTTLVYRGVTLGTRRTVAIRILRFGLSGSPEDVERFLAETRALSRLDHACVVRVLSSGDLEGIPYFVQEYVPGPTLRACLKESGPFTEERALEIISQVAEGLRHAHSLGILHGSLRPSAILIPRLGPAKVTQFALFDWCSFAAARGAARVEAPHHVSPEQAGRTARPTVRSDLYSLGATLFHMLTGRPPFRGDHLEIVRQHRKRPAPDPRVLVPQLTPGCADLVLRLLEKKPENRPESMQEILREIDRVRAQSDDGAVSPPATAVPDRLRSRRRGSSSAD